MLTQPKKSQAHKRLEILKKRSILSVEQQKSLDRMSSGYRGEHHLYRLLQSELRCEPVQLFDLRLKVNSSECQIDCLLIFQNECILIEVKNFQGDFYIENNVWFTLTKKEIKNPLHQLHRTELLLKQFFRHHQIPLNIKPFVVFTHPEFQLYQAPLNIPVVFPTQLKRMIQKFQNIPCQIKNQHQQIVKQLKSQHLPTSSYETVSIDDLSDFRKGVTCENCDGFMEMEGQSDIKCSACHHINHLEQSIMRSVYDFSMLFPNKNITVQSITEWTNHLVSKHRIRTILSRHCQSVQKGRSSYYIFKQKRD